MNSFWLLALGSFVCSHRLVILSAFLARRMTHSVSDVFHFCGFQFFTRIQVAEHFCGEAGGYQLLLCDRLRLCSEQCINLVAAGAESLLRGVAELTAIHGAQGLPASIDSRDRRGRGGGSSCTHDQVM